MVNLKKYLDTQKKVMNEYKWCESEKAGYDIGFEKALLSWVCHHRDKWRNKR